MSEPPPEGAGAVNFGGYGDVDMYPYETMDAARLVFDAGHVFAEAWGRLLGPIEAAEEQLGNGPLAENYVASYNSVEAVVKSGAASVGPTYEGLGSSGAKAVTTYVQIDSVDVPQALQSAAAAMEPHAHS